MSVESVVQANSLKMSHQNAFNIDISNAVTSIGALLSPRSKSRGSDEPTDLKTSSRESYPIQPLELASGNSGYLPNPGLSPRHTYENSPEKMASRNHSISEEESEKLADLVTRRLIRPGGVELKSRKNRFKTYKFAFVGKELVDWMIKNGQAVSRDEAIIIGEKLAQLGFVCHVSGDFGFRDDSSFYRFPKHIDVMEKEKEKDKEKEKRERLSERKSITNKLQASSKDRRANSSLVIPAIDQQNKTEIDILSPFQQAMLLESAEAKSPSHQQQKKERKNETRRKCKIDLAK